MKFNRFYLSVSFRIILIVLSCALSVYFFNRDDSVLTTIFVVFLVFIQTVYLIKYVNKTNKEIAEFLLYLQQGDTSSAFSNENITKTFKGLRTSFDKINTDFQKIRSEKIQKEHYLNYVINNVKIGLIAFNESDTVEFVNNQAKVFLNKSDRRLTNMNNLDPDFVKTLNSTKPSEPTILKKIIQDELFYLSFSLSEFKIDQNKIKLFAIHDVKREIESNEIESWQKLTRVLTHEMMNSLTPITSLSHAIKTYLTKDDVLKEYQEVNNELLSDIFLNADIIENRGKGLLEFIDNYRSITKLPQPKFEEIETKPFLENTIQLFDKELNEKKITLSINSDNYKFKADKGMIEQVVINLIRNSIDASVNTENPYIKLQLTTDESHRTKFTITDNGIGISHDQMENIFIPFFTTKENGSGIGLSLSRQIMYLHGGNINVKSIPNKETVFSLVF